MSGQAIFGTWGTFSSADVEAMGERLKARGSVQTIREVAPNVSLGWRGRAGMYDQGARSVPLVCASTLLNRNELARLAGEVMRPDLSDAELLWKLYLACGPDGFSHINGQFALALFDSASDSMLLAVDCWANRPLSFATCNEGFAFATEYKALLALPGVRTRLNPSAIACLQATKYLPTGEGLFADIFPVAPGCWVRLRGNEWLTKSYDPVRLEQVRRPEKGYSGELREAILGACERLVGDYDAVGVALSGGLDSTLTVGALRKVAPKLPIYTFTVSFRSDDPTFKLARETAGYFHTIHREIVVPVTEFPTLIPELVWIMEDPVAREEMLIYLVLAREAAKKVSYILHGHASDMLFAGMPRHVLVHWASGAPVFRMAVLDLYNYSQTGAAPKTLLGDLLVRTYYRGRRTPPPRVLGMLEASGGKGLELAPVQPLNTLLLDALKHPTEIGGLERLHAWSNLGYGSLFHDLDVVRTAFRIPDSLKIHRLNRKYILRVACEGILPPGLASRPKDIMRIPRNEPLRSVLGDMARELFKPEAVAERGLFDPEEVASLIRTDGSTFAHDHFYHLWTLILTECWMRTFVDNRGAAPIEISHVPSSARRVPTAPPPHRTVGAQTGDGGKARQPQGDRVNLP